MPSTSTAASVRPESDLPNPSRPAALANTPESARNKIIEEYLPFVTIVLAKVQRGLPSHLNSDDLYSSGVDGLIAAAERFDPAKANSFPAYARLRIRCAILDELRRLDTCTRRCRIWNKKYDKAVMDAEQSLGRAPTAEELSDRLGVTTAQLERRRELSKPIQIISLDSEPRGSSNSSTDLHDCIADHGQTDIRETMQQEEMTQLLVLRMAELPDMPRKILAMYYFEGMRFTEIAEAFDLTESRICQIHKETIGKLQATLSSSHMGRPKMADFLRNKNSTAGTKTGNNMVRIIS